MVLVARGWRTHVRSRHGLDETATRQRRRLMMVAIALPLSFPLALSFSLTLAVSLALSLMVTLLPLTLLVFAVAPAAALLVASVAFESIVELLSGDLDLLLLAPFDQHANVVEVVVERTAALARSMLTTELERRRAHYFVRTSRVRLCETTQLLHTCA
jgi:hypothetical protein